ncbi:MAG: FixH family protein [Lysinibacillus sp.]
MKKLWMALALTTALAAGCTEEEPAVDTIGSGEMPVEVVVEVLTPAEAVANEKVTLEAKVTQGDKPIDDATVEFEVWESGLRDEGQMLEGKLSADGVYVADHTFEKDGVYYMYAHTTANSYHVMPKHEFIVGSPDMSQVLEDDSTSSMEHMEEKDAEAGEGHGH